MNFLYSGCFGVDSPFGLFNMYPDFLRLIYMPNLNTCFSLEIIINNKTIRNLIYVIPNNKITVSSGMWHQGKNHLCLCQCMRLFHVWVYL